MTDNRPAAHRLVLGTAQMGLRYGVANRHGKPDAGAVTEILSHARAAGVTTLDTATAYGDAETVLGRAGLAGWQVITKIPSLNTLAPADAGRVARETVQRSCDRLGVAQLHAVLLHDAGDAIGPAGPVLAETLAALQADGTVAHTGLSIYGGQELGELPVGYAPQIIQAPLNLLDQRLLRTGVAARLKQQGCALHARSLFLQGLLLMAPARRPVRFRPWADALARFDARVASLGTDALALCLGFALSAPDIERLVVGVESAAQLDGIIAALARAPAAPDLSDLDSDDPELTDPRRWTQ